MRVATPVSEVASDVDQRLHLFRPVRLRKAADEVVTVIVDAIRGGLFEPGEKLPREVDLASQLEVSRTTVREAIGTMQRAGVVTVRRGRGGGAFVVTRSIPADVLAAIEGESHANMASLLEVRRVLEVPAALLAMRHATEADLKVLERLVRMLDGLLGDPDEFIAVDMLFHMRVAETSKNSYLAQHTRATLHQFAAVRAQYPIGRVDLQEGVRNQRLTLAAISSGDPERVEAAMDEHLGAVEEHFLGFRFGPMTYATQSVERSP